MSARNRQTSIEWVFGGLIVLLCAGLTALQYRWTGEIADAELARLRGNLQEQCRGLVRTCDAELAGSCGQLCPEATDFGVEGWEAKETARYQQWKAGNPRPLFKRIGLAGRGPGEAELYMVDFKTGQVKRSDWPAEWAGLQESLGRRGRGGPPPFRDEEDSLVVIPIMGGPGEPMGMRGDRPQGQGWLVAELDMAYASQTWWPELAAKYLNPDGSGINEARVRTMSPPFRALFSTQTNHAAEAAWEVSVRFNAPGELSQGLFGPPSNGRLGGAGRAGAGRGPDFGGPPPGGSAGVIGGFGPGRGPDNPGPPPGGGWVLEAWHRPGALEAIVSASRQRNLGVSAALNLLLLATGIALVRHTRRERQLAEAQMNFVANISHELRTPLTVIGGAAHNLKRGLVQERRQIEQYARLISEHTAQLSDMIEQLLEFAGAKKNRRKLAWEPVALGQVITDAIGAAEHETQTAGCKIEVDMPAVVPTVNGDAGALRRAFQNLIANAAKHGGEGGWIGVSAAEVRENGERMVEVRVADRGPGIPAREQSNIFKPFVRGALAEAKQIRGSGLGLSLVREIVEEHRGSIRLESEPGRGAIFTVRLPLAERACKP